MCVGGGGRGCSVMFDLIYLLPSAAALFGLAFIVAGLLGTVSGSEMSKFIGRYTKKAECYVCALSLFGAVPFIYFGLIIAHYSNCISADWVGVS